MFLSSHQLQKSQSEGFFPWVEMSWRSPSLAVKRLDRLSRHTAFLMVCHHVPLPHYKRYPGTGFSLLIFCEVSAHVSVHVRVHAKIVTGLCGNIFKFNLLHGYCTFLPFPSTLTSLYTHALSNSPSELGHYIVELVITLYGAHINWKSINWILTLGLRTDSKLAYIFPRTEIWLWNEDATMWNGANIVEWGQYCGMGMLHCRMWQRYCGMESLYNGGTTRWNRLGDC